MAMTRNEAVSLSASLEDAGFPHSHLVPAATAPSAHAIELKVERLTSDQLGALLGIIYPLGKDVTLEGNTARIA